MRWYLTTPEREFSEWMPLAIGRDIPNVSLPTNEPEAAVHGDGWSILPLNDTPPTVPADRYIFSRYVRVDPESALVIYQTREKTQEMIDEELAALPSPVASPPVIKACALRVNVTDGDVSGLGGAFNIAGIVRMDVGSYWCFLANPITGSQPELVANGGGFVGVSEWAEGDFFFECRDVAGGAMVDPETFGFTLYQF